MQNDNIGKYQNAVNYTTQHPYRTETRMASFCWLQINNKSYGYNITCTIDYAISISCSFYDVCIKYKKLIARGEKNVIVFVPCSKIKIKMRNEMDIIIIGLQRVINIKLVVYLFICIFIFISIFFHKNIYRLGPVLFVIKCSIN